MQSIKKILFSFLITASIFAIPVQVPNGDINPDVWEPTSSNWVNNTPNGYSDGSTAPYTVKISTALDYPIALFPELYFDVCLEVERLSSSKYAYSGFNTWDASFTPTTLPGGVSPVFTQTNSFVKTINVKPGSLSVTAPIKGNGIFVALGQPICAPTEIGTRITFRRDNRSKPAYFVLGAKISKIGATLPSGFSNTTVPNAKSAAFINGNFTARFGGILLGQTVNLTNVSATPGINLKKSVTTATGTCGVDDLNSVSVISGEQAKFCFKIENTGLIPLTNVSLQDTTLGLDLTSGLAGLTDQDGDSAADDLAVGSFATGELLHTVKSSITNTAVASGSSIESSDTSIAQTYICGDNQLNPGEACDDGNNVSGDGCNSVCSIESCGNGVSDSGEECDDSNTISGDGCSGTCRIEVCGDSILTSPEGCDDGNITSGDGCSSDCQIEVCGNGIVDTTEQCDDGNTVGGDLCSPACSNEVCGNGIQDSGEDCDDENTVSGDGCSESCKVEACGNAVLDSGEECDDGNTTQFDGCSSTCAVEPEETPNPSPTPSLCGNEVVNEGEGCDDANTISGDGCSSTCSIEETGSCGNSELNGDEECDDGNTASGDGCSSTCTNEVISPVCGNGTLEEAEECDDANSVQGDGCTTTCKVEPVDCKGVINGTTVVDRCGVCGGDGSACLGCTQVRVESTQIKLDGGAARQYLVFKEALALLKKTNKKIKPAALNTLAKRASDLHAIAWATTWSIPSTQLNCTSSNFCVAVSNTSQKSIYQDKVVKMSQLIDYLFKQMPKNLKGNNKRFLNNLVKLSVSLLKVNISNLDGIPNSSSNCSK